MAEKSAVKQPEQAVEHGGKPAMAVKVYAPFQVYFEGEAYSVSAVNDVGPFDILPRHRNFLCMLVPCQLKIRPVEGPERSIKIHRALMQSKSTEKKPSKLKRFFKKANVYFLLFLLVLVIAAAIAIVTYLNSQKPPVEPTVASQELTEEALQELANTDTSVGSADQTLTIQGNAVIDGQTLMRGNLNVAGNFQTGGSIQGPTLTISGATNLADTQINTLQVAGNTAIQGNTTIRDLNVSGTTTLAGAVTASQITVSRLILSGNASLEIPNHIGFTGPSPTRTINAGVLGSGGSASVNGSDTSGTVNINTGNSPSAGCFVRINFNQQFTSQPKVVISPIGRAAGQTQYYVDRDQSGFSICTASPAPANQGFAFDYFIAN